MKTTPAEAKVFEALDRIQAAQRELELACQALSPVVGAMPDWEHLSKLTDRVQAEWHRLNSKLERGSAWRAGLRLDSEPFEFTGACERCGELVSDGRRVHRECEPSHPHATDRVHPYNDDEGRS